MGRNKICLPHSRRHQKQGPGAQHPRPTGPTGSGGGARPRRRLSAPVLGWPVLPQPGARPCRLRASAVGPATPGLPGGAGCPAGRKASVTITIAVRALRGGGTGNSDLSGPAAVAAAAAFCVRSGTAGDGRAPAGPSASSQRRRGRGAGHPSRRKGGRGKRQKTQSLLVYFYLFLSCRDYVCLNKITIVKPKNFFKTSGWVAGAQMSLDSGIQTYSEKQSSPAGAGAELCIAVKFECLCLPLRTRSVGLSAVSVYISGSVFTVPVSVCANIASFASALLLPS